MFTFILVAYIVNPVNTNRIDEYVLDTLQSADECNTALVYMDDKIKEISIALECKQAV